MHETGRSASDFPSKNPFKKRFKLLYYYILLIVNLINNNMYIYIYIYIYVIYFLYLTRAPELWSVQCVVMRASARLLRFCLHLDLAICC